MAGADPAARDVEQARGLYDSMVQHTHVEHMRKLDDESVDTSECDQLVETYWGELRATIEQRVHEQYKPVVEALEAAFTQAAFLRSCIASGEALNGDDEVRWADTRKRVEAARAALASLKGATDGE